MKGFTPSFYSWHNLVPLLVLLAPHCCRSLISQPCVVQVCRNKNCCKQAPYLLETVSDLLLGGGGGSVLALVESSGCLSHCEKGATIKIELPGKPPIFLHEVKTVNDVLVQVEVATEGAIQIPKLLGAAAMVMERVQAITEDPAEQERLLSSVITKLLVLPTSIDHNHCTALAHAYSLRARALADQKKWPMAMEDAQKVVLGEKLRLIATDASISQSYRVWADAEEQLGLAQEEGSGEALTQITKERVLAVLQHWQKAQPSYRTKLQREMHEILEK